MSPPRRRAEEYLVWLPGETQQAIGISMTREDGQRWLAPGWVHLTRSLAPMAWLTERYPELHSDQEPQRSMAQFDFLMCLAYGLDNHRAVGWYSLGGAAAGDLALQLHDDVVLRTRVATALGTTLADLDERADSALSDVHRFPGSFEHPSSARALLVHGREAG